MRAARVRFCLIHGDRSLHSLLETACIQSELCDEFIHYPESNDALRAMSATGMYIRRHTPDLIFLDTGTDAQQGLLHLKEFRKIEALEYVPIIVLSNLDSEQLRERAYKYMASSYLVKKGSEDEMIGSLLSTSRYWMSLLSELDDNFYRDPLI